MESRTSAVLVDAGLSYRELGRRFAAIGREAPKNVAALIVTHSHSDHAAHASTYATRLNCPVLASEATMPSIRLRPAARAETFVTGRPLVLDDITIRSLSIPHDVPQVALRFETKTTSVG
ncbi:MAG: MBL fold metallo-hydrolase, partial [Polyangiales bacterium]